jgi:hypothetical protein
MTIPVKELLTVFKRDKQNMFLLIPQANRHTLLVLPVKIHSNGKRCRKKLHLNSNFFEHIQLIQRHTGTPCYGGKGIIGNSYG